MGESVDLEEITLINVFTVEAKDQRRLLELLTRATDGPVGAAPGCIGAALLGSIDGSKVTMQSGWRSEADYAAMRDDPGHLPFYKRR